MSSEEKVGVLKAELISRFAEKPHLQAFDLHDICFKGEPLDAALQRFLQARKFNLDATEECIQKSLLWRKCNAQEFMKLGKEACLGAKIVEVQQFYAGGYAGSCKEGRPIWYERTGAVDIEALHCITTDEAFSKYHVCLMEELQDKYQEASAKRGEVINKTVSILDLEGFAVSKLNSETMALIKSIIQIDSANYPETMGKMFIINSPSIFSFSWNAIQSFLDPRTVSKIEVLGGSTQWRPRLLELIDESELPEELGGGGPLCTPQKAFKEETLASGDVVMEEVVVTAGQDVYYKFFTRAGGNICFQLKFVGDKGDSVDLLPEKQYEASECSSGKCVTGTLPAPNNGKVVASWRHPNWFSRVLLYRVI